MTNAKGVLAPAPSRCVTPWPPTLERLLTRSCPGHTTEQTSRRRGAHGPSSPCSEAGRPARLWWLDTNQSWGGDPDASLLALTRGAGIVRRTSRRPARVAGRVPRVQEPPKLDAPATRARRTLRPLRPPPTCRSAPGGYRPSVAVLPPGWCQHQSRTPPATPASLSDSGAAHPLADARSDEPGEKRLHAPSLEPVVGVSSRRTSARRGSCVRPWSSSASSCRQEAWRLALA
jgi:hypothetical protein